MNIIAHKLLLIEDDFGLRSLIKEYLEQHNFLVDVAGTISEAEEQLKTQVYSVILLDIMMPDASGFDFLKKFREKSNTSVIAITARDSKEDIIKGLSLGADYYLIKPFEPEELVTKIYQIFQKPQPQRISISLAEEVDIEQFKQQLSSTEYNLLSCLVSHIGEPVSREYLARNSHTSDRSIDVQINRLRKKLEAHPEFVIKTVRHKGYALITTQ